MKRTTTQLNSTIEKRSLNSLLANLIQFSLQFVQAIVLVPLLLNNWGADKYGVWIAVFSFFTLLQTFDSGHQNYIGNEFNKLFHLDKPEAKKILASSIRACLVIGLLELLILIMIIIFNFTPSFVGITSEASKEMGVEWGLISIMLVWLLSGNIGGILVRMILPLGMMARSIYLGIILKAIQIIILVIAGLFKFSIFEACFYTALSSLIYSYLLFIYIRYLMPEFYPWWTGGNWHTGFSNLKKSIVLTYSNLLVQFSNSGIVLIITNFLNASFVPLFTTIRTLGNTALQGTGMVITPLYPEMIRYYVKKEPDKLLDMFETNWVITGFIVNCIFIISLLFIEPLYTWWTKGILHFDLALYSIIVASVILANFSKGFITFLTGINSLRAISIINTTRFFITALLSILLINTLGLFALGLALFFGEVIAAFYSHTFANKSLKQLNSSLKLNVIILNIIAVIITIGILFINYFLKMSYFIVVFTGIGLLIIIYSRLFILLSNDVKNRFYNLLTIKS